MAIVERTPHYVSTRIQELAQAVHANTTPASANGLPNARIGRNRPRESFNSLFGRLARGCGGLTGNLWNRKQFSMMHMAIDEGVNFFDNALGL